MFKPISKMDKQRQTAREMAPRTLVIFRDCHKRNNLIIPIEDRNEERFYRNFARRMGWPCCIRKAEAHTELQTRSEVRAWRKPSCIEARPRPKLFGAFNLTLTASAMEGGEA